MQWLVSMLCGLGLWALVIPGGTRPAWRVAVFAALLVLCACLGPLGLHQEVIFLAAGLTLITIGASLANDGQTGRAMQLGLLAAAGLTALIGLCQYFGLSVTFTPWMSPTSLGQAYGNLRQPNQYASLCWLGLAILLWGTLRLPRAATLALTVLLAVGSAASFSRTGMLAGLVLTALATIWAGPQRPHRLLLCGIAAASYFSAAMALPLLLEASTGVVPARTLWARFGDGEPCSSRLVLWSNVLHLIAQKPLLGWGWGELDYAHFVTFYPGGRFCEILDNAHNLPLHLAVELGLPAAIFVCVGSTWWVLKQRPFAERLTQRQLGWALLAVILLHSQLEYPLWYGPFQIAFGLSLGWLLPQVAPGGWSDRYRPAAAAAAVAMLALTAYAAWDYTRVSQIYLQPDERRANWRQDPLAHARGSWLFASQARFAELTLTEPNRANAEGMYRLSLEMLHYSPEPRVIERVIESAAMTGRQDEAVLYLARLRAAFPVEYAAWQAQQRLPIQRQD